MRLLLYLSFILVAGCSSSDPSGTNNPKVTGNEVIFNPLTGDIPLPNTLATGKNVDPLVGRAANTPMTPGDALNYVNIYEAFSYSAVSGVNAPIYIRFSSPVDPATVTAANIKVFQLTLDSDSITSTENAALGFKDVSGMFDYSKYTAGSTDLLIFPKFPLSPVTRYLYVVTNRVLDAASGTPVISSKYFDVLKSKYELVGETAALEPVRANLYTDASKASILVSGYAKVMDDLIIRSERDKTTIISRNDIALMGRFITTAAGFVSKDGALSVASMIPVESALRAFAAGATLGGLTGKTWTNSVTVNTPTGLTPAAFWAAAKAGTAPATVASVVTGTINSAEISIDPVIARANATTMDLSTVTGAYNPFGAGVVQAFRSSGNLTGFYHKTSTVPFVYLAPTTPNGKTILFQHGITGQKEQVVAVASTLTGAGYAVVAIDLPQHGALAVPTHTTGSVWGQDFMAVGAPLATRSNIQQAAFNLNRLELTLKTGGFVVAGIATAPPTEIKFVGISLGSIVGAYYLAGNTTLATTGYPYTQTTLNSDMKGFLSVPGGRTAYLIQNSPSFSPSVNAGLAAMGIVTGSPTYHKFFQVTQSVVDPADPASLTTPLATGLPSRLSGRIAIQEAIGDQVIPNENTRYLGNALGGREVLGPAGAAVAPAFKQLGYRGATTPRIPSLFLYTLTSGAPAAKVDFAAKGSSAATSPAEGYFQFDQTGINHGSLLDPTASLANTGYMQSQMLQYLLYGGIVDPTPTGAAKQAVADQITGVSYDVSLPPVLKIFGY
jgi:hypothetical protein